MNAKEWIEYLQHDQAIPAHRVLARNGPASLGPSRIEALLQPGGIPAGTTIVPAIPARDCYNCLDSAECFLPPFHLDGPETYFLIQSVNELLAGIAVTRGASSYLRGSVLSFRYSDFCALLDLLREGRPNHGFGRN